MLLVPLLLVLSAGDGIPPQDSSSVASKTYTDSFDTGRCNFSSTGENEYCVLKPGYRMIFEGGSGDETTRLEITVLNETRMIGNVETRIVEEKESVTGKIREISRNYFAFCTRTNSVFYFGEDVDMYRKGTVAGHDGSWRVGEGGANAGIMIPGIPLIGSRYYQEIAPGVAMDRAEIVSLTESVVTPAGRFDRCLMTEETTPLERGVREYKWYARGIGLVRDGDLLLKEYGFEE